MTRAPLCRELPGPPLPGCLPPCGAGKLPQKVGGRMGGDGWMQLVGCTPQESGSARCPAARRRPNVCSPAVAARVLSALGADQGSHQGSQGQHQHGQRGGARAAAAAAAAGLGAGAAASQLWPAPADCAAHPAAAPFQPAAGQDEQHWLGLPRWLTGWLPGGSARGGAAGGPYLDVSGRAA